MAALLSMDEGECWALLPTVPVGRVGVSVRALPVVVPVRFSVVDQDVVFRTAMGGELHSAVHGNVVAFEAGHYDAEQESGWSVLIRGRASLINDPEELALVDSLDLPTWSLDGEPDRWARITSSLVAGSHFSTGP
ncbi:MAG TPA: pyridoxamine 5'-phosphate oxidase family protein [Acidimicrobiales bacterium]|nr:pyridoxamine 5'-phosphate oxidase family protein [Acidimicrobiales bacterium]